MLRNIRSQGRVDGWDQGAKGPRGHGLQASRNLREQRRGRGLGVAERHRDREA